jgi:hypothetical protein
MEALRIAEAGVVVHELKCDGNNFADICVKTKTAEIRKDDRCFEVGDYILLRRTTFTSNEMKNDGKPLIYNGESAMLKITHIHSGVGMEEWYVALSFVVLD